MSYVYCICHSFTAVYVLNDVCNHAYVQVDQETSAHDFYYGLTWQEDLPWQESLIRPTGVFGIVRGSRQELPKSVHSGRKPLEADRNLIRPSKGSFLASYLVVSSHCTRLEYIRGTLTIC